LPIRQIQSQRNKGGYFQSQSFIRKIHHHRSKFQTKLRPNQQQSVTIKNPFEPATTTTQHQNRFIPSHTTQTNSEPKSKLTHQTHTLTHTSAEPFFKRSNIKQHKTHTQNTHTTNTHNPKPNRNRNTTQQKNKNNSETEIEQNRREKRDFSSKMFCFDPADW
jgi:hypothetical protein